MWPRRAWRRLYEPRIRAPRSAAGRAPDVPDPDRYANRYAHCDVLIVGGGAAGLAAALTAAVSGARVILCDEQAQLGGALLSDTPPASRPAGGAALGSTTPRDILAARANVTVLRAHHRVWLFQPQLPRAL